MGRPEHVVAYFDGACLPVNPGGIATCGVVLEITAEGGDSVIHRAGRVVSENGTNNVAEWSGLIMALEKALDTGSDSVVVRGDSQLVVNQFNGVWAVRASHLLPYLRRARDLAKRFRRLTVEWIPREQNPADEVAHAVYREYVERREAEKAFRQCSEYVVTEVGEGVYSVEGPRGSYTVDVNKPHCTCPRFRKLNAYRLVRRSGLVLRCKHFFVVEQTAELDRKTFCSR